MERYRDFLGLGIAGNFALHLAQAGEEEDFKNIITADEAAPKGMFPFYLPSYTPSNNKAPKDILSTYPLSFTQLKLPKESANVQAEPEVALLCELEYENEKISKITPTHFTAYNDASIRVAGAQKISDKKNWGENSKGISKTLLKIDKFKATGVMDKYSICSFLKRDEGIHAYGENVELSGYSYFYSKLTQWMQNQINTQENFGPLEPLNEYIQACNYPKKAIISIGATRYTEYGEKTFLQKEDEIFIILYNHEKYTLSDILTKLTDDTLMQEDISLLAQKVL